MSLDLKQIKAIAAIKEHGSFRVAAGALGLSPSALTKMIQAVEAELGASLIDRSRRPISLTTYGEVVYEQGNAALEEIAQGLKKIEVLRGLERAEVTIATSALLSGSIAGAALEKLIPDYPNVHFLVNSVKPRDAAQQFKNGEADFFIGDAEDLEASDDFESALIPWPEIAYLYRAGHPLADLPQISVVDCLVYPMIGPRPPRWWEHYFRDWALGIGVPLPTGYEATSPEHRLQSSDWAIILHQIGRAHV